VQMFGRPAKVQLFPYRDEATKLFQFIHPCKPGINPCPVPGLRE
jgi:hypothetical protein